MGNGPKKLVFHGNSLEFFGQKNTQPTTQLEKPQVIKSLEYFSIFQCCTTLLLSHDLEILSHRISRDPVDPQRMPQEFSLAIYYRLLYHYMKPSKDYSLFGLLFIWFLYFCFLKGLSLFLLYTNKRNRLLFLFQSLLYLNNKKQHVFLSSFRLTSSPKLPRTPPVWKFVGASRPSDIPRPLIIPNFWPLAWGIV